MKSHCLVLLLLVTVVLACSSEDSGRSVATPRPPERVAPAPRVSIDVADVVRTAQLAFRPTTEGWSAAHTTHQVLFVPAGRLVVTPYGTGVGGSERGVAGAPMVVATQSVRRGSRTLTSSRGSTQIARDGVLEIGRGGTVETLRNDERGVEQSWKFAGRPEGSGELAVRVRVSGQAYRGATESGLHFVDDKTGLGFRYGTATWIDANGRRTTITPAFASGAIVLRVPADVVESSAYPAVLDPLIGPEFGMDSPLYVPAVRDQTQAAVSFGNGQYLVVWVDSRFNGTAVFGARVTTAGTVLDPGGILLSELPHVVKAPKVAFDGTRWFVVWSEVRGLDNHVMGAHVDANGLVENPGGAPVYTVNGANVSPAGVVFDGVNYMVAWVFAGDSLGGGILAAPVTPAGVPGAPITVASHPSYVRDVAIAWNGTYYGLAWGTSLGMYARRMATDGTFPDAAPVLIDSGSIDYNNASNIQELGGTAATSDGTDFLFFWRQRNASNVFLKYRRVSGSTGAPLGSINWIDGVSYQANPFQDAGGLSATFTGSGYLLGWAKSVTGSINTFVGTLTTAGGQSGSVSVSTGALNWTTAVGYDGTNAFLAWGRGVGASSDLYGTRLTLALLPLDAPGFLIGGTANLQTRPDVAFNGQNLLVVWEDTRFGTKDIFGARVSPTGSVLDPTGIAISDATGDQTMPAVAAVGSDFFVVWQDARTDTGDVFGTLVTGGGLVQSTTGVPLSVASGTQSAPDIAGGSTEYFAVWGHASDIYGTVISAGGTVQNVGGIPVCNEASLQLSPAIASNGVNLFVAWQDYRTGGVPDIYGGRISGGTPDALSGMLVSATADLETVPAVASDGSGFLVTWQSTPGAVLGPGNIRAARVSGSATVSDLSGIDVALGSNTSPETAWDGANYWLVWGDVQGNVAGRRLDEQSGVFVDTPSLVLSAYPDDAAYTPTPAIARFGPQQSLLVYQRGDLEPAFGGARVKARRIVEPGSVGTRCYVDTDCTSIACVDGVCCSTACDGPCEACSAAKQGGGSDGTCGPIANGTDPDTECTVDALSCTTAACVSGACTQMLVTGCLIGGACFADGATNPADVCAECDPVVSTSAWTTKSDGSACSGDGIACTTDACVGGACTHEITAGSCLIAGACYTNGATNPADPCSACDTAATPSAWTTRADGSVCTTDGLSCTLDRCVGGACTHAVAAGSCLIAGTCYADNATNPSAPCLRCNSIASSSAWTEKVDGTGCTSDTLVCTTDACQAGACTHTLTTDSCFISGACRVNGATNPANSCEVCSATDSQNSWTPLSGCSGTGGAGGTAGSGGAGGVGGIGGIGGDASTDSGADAMVDSGSSDAAILDGSDGASGAGGSVPSTGGSTSDGSAVASGGVSAGGASGAGGATATGGTGAANSGGATASGDASTPGGSAGAGGSDPDGGSSSDDGGCGCRVPNSRTGGQGIAFALAALMLGAARKRRRALGGKGSEASRPSMYTDLLRHR